MKLSELEPLKSFALSGPGYGDGETSLLTNLVREEESPDLVYCPYESPGSAPRSYSGDLTLCKIELEPQNLTPLTVGYESRGYHQAIETICASIAAGDVYQVNYSLRAKLGPISGAALANRLCRRGMPSYFSWVRFPEGDELVSASPECLFAIDDRKVRCEPMKGTAPPEQETWLRESDKNRAELFMITDLMRNDLIPVCEPGSVQVKCERRFISLPYAVQTVSDIEGNLLPGLGPREVLAALHPGGSVTGAPKHAAMRMITDLEEGPRGAYCGALGLIRGARSRFSILIRTAEKNAEGWIYGVGGGVVWQSSADDELSRAGAEAGSSAMSELQPYTPYTSILVNDRGVVLYAQHLERMSRAGDAAANLFRDFASSAAAGVYSIRATAGGLDIQTRGPSAIRDGQPVRFLVSPYAARLDQHEKPAPPSLYNSVREPGIATLLTSLDGIEILRKLRGRRRCLERVEIDRSARRSAGGSLGGDERAFRGLVFLPAPGDLCKIPLRARAGERRRRSHRSPLRPRPISLEHP